jgi:predicted metal-dependent enzyme (double-stranded beta helix superfamily)
MTTSTRTASACISTVPGLGLDLAELPDRDLDRGELVDLVRRVGDRPELWRPHVAFDDDDRHYVCLHRDAHLDLWILCWTPANDTGWHDHDTSSGAVAVVDGILLEQNLAVGSPEISRRVEAGKTFDFGPDHIHRVSGLAAGSVSIHAYSPPLWRLGQYTIDRSGALRRTSVSYAEELRPIDQSAAS